MAEKNVFVGGTLDRYDKRLQYYVENEATFEVRKYGLTRRISFPDSKVTWKFFGTHSGRGKQFVDGSWFASMVRKEIDAYIEGRGVVAMRDKPDIQQFDMDAIRGAIGQRVKAIDINSCHWTTAYQLGFMSAQTFARGIKSGKKKGLLVSIGSLNKLEQVEVYEKGELSHSYFDHEKHAIYSPFYWAVICRVRDVMMELYQQLNGDLFMWLTDCAFVRPERADEVRQFLSDKGYKTKEYDIDFIEVTKSKVVWFDPKSPHNKFVGYHGRDFETQFILWKQMDINE